LLGEPLFFNSEEKWPKDAAPDGTAHFMQKAHEVGTLCFSPEAGFADRPSLAWRRRLRHPCLAPRANARGPISPRAAMLGGANGGESQQKRQQQTVQIGPPCVNSIAIMYFTQGIVMLNEWTKGRTYLLTCKPSQEIGLAA
jgi:hypothetical protein